MPFPFVPGEVLTAANLNDALNQRMMADGTGLAFVPGAVLFGASTGKFATDSANIFFDDTNNRLGIRTNTPQAMLQVGKTAATARAYNSYTDTANGEWSYLGDWGPPLTNTAVYGSDRNGTGIARDVVFVRGGVEMLRLAAGGVIAPGGIAQTQPVPVMLGSTAQAGTSRGVAVSGNYAYATISATVQTLEIFDITVPTAPTKIGGIDLPAGAIGQPVVAGQIVYVGVNSNTAGIQIIDVSNPKAPTVIRSLNAGGVAIGTLALSGPYLYVGHSGAGTNFRVWDVSDPANPVAKSALFPLAGAAGIISIAVQGKYAFVAASQAVVGTGGLYVIDVSDPANPVLVSTYNAASSGRGVTVAGKYLYLTASVAASGLEVVDISDPTLPVLVKLFATPLGGGSSVNPVVAGNYLFLANNSGSGLQTVSIADPANPVAIGNTAVGAVLGLSISGNKLYVTAATLLRVLDTFGVDTPSARAGALSTDTLNVDGQSFFAGDIFAQRGLVVGQTGINSRGQVTGGTVRSVGNAFLATASIGTLNTAQAMLHVGGSAGTARVYNSYTDTANGEWSYLGDFGPPLTNVASYGTGKNGTGASRAVAFVVGDVEAARFDTTGCLLIGATSGTSGMLNVLGSYTTAQLTLMYNNATLNSSNTGTHYGFWNRPNFNPTGASLGNVFGLASTPQMSAASVLTITNFCGFQSQLQTAAGYAGTLTNGAAFLASNPSILGTNPITNCYGFWQNGISNGNGATTGTIVNRGVSVTGINAGSAGATITNYAAQFVVPSGGASAGTTTNYGVYISSNGGTASGGTVTNYALYSDSTAPSLLTGLLVFGGTTTAFPALKRNAAALEVRLANDSAYANLTAQYLGLNGQVATVPFDLRNTFTTSVEATLFNIAATLASTATGLQYGVTVGPGLQPSGASLGFGAGIVVTPKLLGSVAVTELAGLYASVDITGYTGANPAQGEGLYIGQPVGGTATKRFTTYSGIYMPAATNGHGITSGTVNNYGVAVGGATSGAAAGGTIVNSSGSFSVPSGSGAGNTTNYGLYIGGNGGSGGGGTTNNFGFVSESAALSYINSLRIGAGGPNPTNATAPFLYIPACAGVPTGVPLFATAGAVALQYDSTNKKLMLYDPLTLTWKGVAVA